MAPGSSVRLSCARPTRYQWVFLVLPVYGYVERHKSLPVVAVVCTGPFHTSPLLSATRRER